MDEADKTTVEVEDLCQRRTLVSVPGLLQTSLFAVPRPVTRLRDPSVSVTGAGMVLGDVSTTILERKIPHPPRPTETEMSGVSVCPEER